MPHALLLLDEIRAANSSSARMVGCCAVSGYLTAIACSASCEVLANGPAVPLVSQWHCVLEAVAVAESPALDLLAVHCTSMSMGEACTAMLASQPLPRCKPPWSPPFPPPKC